MPDAIGMPIRANQQLLAYASSIVQAYVSRNPVVAAEVPAMIRSIHMALAGLAGGANTAAGGMLKPAVPIKRSVFPEYVVCLEDGKKLKMLKRYLRARHGLSVEEYRAKWGLPHDYPVVAPAYAARRSQFAKKFGLGKRQTPTRKRKRR